MQLGFLSFVPNPHGSTGAGRALEDGIRLFQHAEDLGYDVGWVRVRHLEQFPSSPLTFLTAVGMRTNRIRLSTGVIPIRYEDPIRLAEDAATVDLLTGGRLELGVAGGIQQMAFFLDPVFGPSDRTFADESQARLTRLRAALAGEPVVNSGPGFLSVPPDTDLTVTPHSPGLADRVWWGPGSLASARRAGEQGLDIHVSTVNTEETGQGFVAGQAQQLRAYREAFATSEAGQRRTPRLAAGRIILPILSGDDRDAYEGFIRGYTEGIDEQGRLVGVDAPVRFDRIYSGDPDEIVADLRVDEALAQVTELTVTLPEQGGIDAHLRTLDAVAKHVAPGLGWVPAG